MRYLVAALLFAVMPSALAASADACYTIPDADQRQFCLAKARKDPSTCYAIKGAPLRAQCLAEVRK